MKRGFVKNSSENAPWSERSAALHAGAIKPAQEFVVPVLILPKRPSPVPPDKCNEGSKRDWRQKQISGKIDPLVF